MIEVKDDFSTAIIRPDEISGILAPKITSKGKDDKIRWNIVVVLGGATLSFAFQDKKQADTLFETLKKEMEL